LSIITFLIQPDPPKRLDKALSRDVPEDADISRSQMVQLMAKGAIAIDGQTLTDTKAKPQAGQTVTINVPDATDVETVAQDIPLDVIYEDDDLIVVNKPAGMVVHPAPGSPRDTLVNALLHHCADSLSGIGGEKRPGIVHRIDKDTSGLLVVAKNDRAHHGLAQQFERHSVERYYRALCFGVPDANDPRVRGVRGVNFEPGNIMKITTHLARHKTDRQRQAVLFDGGRHAVTRVRIVDRFGTPPVVSLVECWLETGRTHQIRVHMAHTGHGLVGDPVYGGRRKISHKSLTPNAVQAIQDFDRQALHAAVLGFEHPVSGEMMRFEADLPTDMITLLSNL
jgi:23S rRNA pseudouridine1911/1915/1917 synthase